MATLDITPSVHASLEFEVIEKLFSTKKYFCGGPIPRHLLFTVKNKELLQKIELADAISVTHAAIDRVRVLAKSKHSNKIGQKLIPKIIHACENHNIPKEKIGGLMIMYMELIEGCPCRNLLEIVNTKDGERYQLKNEKKSDKAQ